MARYVAKRLVTSIGLLFLSTIVIFLLMRVIPGDPTITKLGGSIKEVDREHARADPARARPRRVAAAAVRSTGSRASLHGDFGSSYFSQFSVTTLIGQRIGATLLLALMSMVIGLAIAVPAAWRARSGRTATSTRALSAFAAVGIAIPDVRHRDRADHHPRRRARRAADAGIRLVPARPGRLDAGRRSCPRSRSGSASRRVDDADPARLARSRSARPRSSARRGARGCFAGRSSPGTSSRTRRSRRSRRRGSSSPTSSAAR